MTGGCHGNQRHPRCLKNRAWGPGEKGHLASDFPEETGGQARVPQRREGNLARLHSGCGGVRRREPPRSAARRSAPAPDLASGPCPPWPSGERRRGLLVTDLRAKLIFSLPTEMFRSRTLPGEPLNSRQPPRSRGPPTRRDWLKLPTASPLGRKRRLSSVFIGQHSCQSNTLFWRGGCCLLDWPDAFPTPCAR